jgi:biopolymer transport protein ExbD
MKQKNKYETKSEINVTSLVDVTMILLIVFMITAPLLNTGLKMDLPSTVNATPNEKIGIEIAIKEDNTIYINGKKVNDEEFDRYFIGLKRKVENNSIFLQAGKKTTYDSVINVLDKLKGFGITDITLVTYEKPKK